MVSSVSTSNSYSVILNDLLSAQNKEITAQQQVSTGKKGDDLAGFGDQTRNLVATNTVKSRVDGMVDQLGQLQVKLSFQQTALGQVSDVATSLTQSLTNALATGSGQGLMDSVSAAFSQASQALNTQYGGDYLFSGGQTQTQPFTATSLANLASAPVSSSFQNGNLATTSQIDDNTTIKTGFLASDVGQQLMQAFSDIQTFQQGSTGNFSGNLTDAQQTFIQGMITTLNGVETATTNTTAAGGGIQKQVETATTAQTDRQTTLKNVVDDMTSVNMAQAASDLTQAQNAVQASAQVFMTLKGMSLLNYLTSTA
jgi:flagellar hook-associated protein 3 FlgL